MRRKSRIAFVSMLAGLMMVMTTSPALAAAKTGCPVATGWEEMTVEAAAAAIWPYLVDQSPWADVVDFENTTIRAADRGGDGSLCLKTMWGETLNPNANWYGVYIFIIRDNNANASNK